MYRIRRETGEEITLGSIDEFSAAVAAGLVTAKGEIFHARAEKWLPIASHPHFKMAQDRKRPTASASGQRPAVTAPPQLRVMRPDTAPTAAAATSEQAVAQKPAPRWNSAQRPAARAVAPKPAPAAPPAGDLRLVRADTLLSGAATAPALPEVEFELLPVPEKAVEPVAPPPAPAPAPTPVEPVVANQTHAVDTAPAEPEAAPEIVDQTESETVVERTPAAVELVSKGDVEIINPDRTMPVVPEAEIPALEIPAPIRDFAPADGVAPAAPARSRTPLILGLGVAAVAAAVIGFFVLKPSSEAPAQSAAVPPSASTSSATAGSAPVATAPAATVPAATVPEPETRAAVAAPSAPTGSATGLGGDVTPKKPKQASAETLDDGLEPPPDVMPAAPALGAVGDAAALPTVETSGATLKMLDRANALERQRRLIDSSMRQ